jgi:hypothetical protein
MEPKTNMEEPKPKILEFSDEEDSEDDDFVVNSL